MKCPYCNSDIKSGIKFCTNCGQALEASAQQGPATPEAGEPVTRMMPPPYGRTGQTGPSRWFYGLSALIFVVGIVSFVLLLISGLKSIENSLTRIVVPGKYDINLKDPGKYLVFYEYRSVIGNRVFNTGEKIPHMKCNIVSKITGQPVVLANPSTSYSYSTGRAGVGVLEFTISQPGVYEISAWYPEGRLGQEIVLAVGRGFGTRLMTTIVSCLAVLGGSILLAIVVFVVTLIKRRRALRP